MEVLENRIFIKDPDGTVTEDFDGMTHRVARALAATQDEYDDFRTELDSLRFLPNSPALVNAGRDFGQLAACFVIPIEDSIEGIMGAASIAAKIHQTGGGTGFDFSRLREAGSRVRSTGNYASGPISFIDIFDVTTGAIKQGGVRRGANMGILRVDHPDIEEFIRSKQYVCTTCATTRTNHAAGHEFLPKERRWQNFNISVAITDEFLEALRNDRKYSLKSPLGRQVSSIEARRIWNQISAAAWDAGDPGLFFVDRANRASTLNGWRRIEATNPCGEVPLLPYETCNLGSVDLARMVDHTHHGVVWSRLERTVRIAVRFLNRIIDKNNYPARAIAEATDATRKVGLGVMGFADMLIALRIPYDSREALQLADKLGEFVSLTAHDESSLLAQRDGSFPVHDKSRWTHPMRNSSVTVIAPTGTIARIADTSSGIEPLFRVNYTSNIMDTQLENRHKMWGDVDPSLFRTANEISPEWHIKMQAAWQLHIDDAVSKTVNMPHDASIEDVQEVYEMAVDYGVKGVTVFRDGSLLGGQVLNEIDECPDCHISLIHTEGCSECPECTYSRCDI